MAKYCDVCKQPYPDSEAACPHCAAVVEVEEAPASRPATGSESAIDLGPVAPGEASESAVPSAAPGPKSDPSGADWVVQAGQAKAPPPAASPEEQLQEVSAYDFGIAAPSEAAAGEDSSAVDLGAAAEGPGSGSSAVQLGAAAAQSSSSAVKLAGAAGASHKAEEATEFGEEGLGAPAPAAEEEEDTQFLDELEVEASSAVNLGPTAPSGERPSGRDLIAEAVESGVDLAEEKAAPVAGEAEDSTVDLGAAAFAFGASSSSQIGSGKASEEGEVDLGAEATVEAAPSSSAVNLGGAAKPEPEVGQGSKPDSSSVELGGPARGTRKGKETVAAPAGVDLGEVSEEEGPEAREEEPAASPEEPQPRDLGKAPKPHYGRRWVGGGLIGAVVGVGACVALWLFGIVPPSPWQPAGGPPPSGLPRPGTGGPPPAPPVDAAAELKSGNFAKALPVLEAAAEAPEALAQRGEARWLAYLQEQMVKGKRPEVNDPAVKQAEEDLTKAAQANNPEAVFYLGHLRESTNLQEALKIYGDGLLKFQNDPVWRKRFQAAIDRLTSQAAHPAGGAMSRPGDDARAAAEALLILLTAFQPPSPDQPPPGQPGAANTDTEEAGFKFWEAVKLAQQGKYSDAIKALDEAKKVHDQNRFKRLRKAQNPFSDPTENIFLKSCDELRAYWDMRAKLGNQSLDIVLTNARQADETILALSKKLNAKPGELAQGVDKLLNDKKTADQKAQKLEVELTTAKKEIDTAREQVRALDAKVKTTESQLKAEQGKLKAVTDSLAAAGIKLPDAVKGVEQLAAERTALDKSLADVAARLEGAGVKVTRAEVVKGVERVVDLAKTKDPMGQLTASQNKIRQLEGVLSQRRTPAELLDVWLPVLADRTQKDAAMKATADADRAAKEPGVSPAVLGKSMAVQGLCLRNLGDFDSARKTLDQALKLADRAEWRAQVEKALKELNDPTAYYLPRARELCATGQAQAALDVLSEAQKVFPKDSGPLLAQRSLARLDLARDKGKGKVEAADVAEAVKDAQAAAAAGSAEGHYALGRIAEELGNLTEARQAYQAALKVHAAPDEAGNRYRMALARVLLKVQQTKAGTSDKAARHPARDIDDVLRDPLGALVLLLELAMPPGPGPEAEEAARLADEVLASKDADFLLRAQALAVKGLWTRALQTYADGLRPNLRRDQAEVLALIVSNHPALKRPDSLAIPNPLLAEAHYAAGLRHYFARRYPEAKEAFLNAIQASNQDARFFYYLGLTRLALGERENANADFEQGARLEADDRPASARVSRALERVQGPARMTVNRFRP